MSTAQATLRAYEEKLQFHAQQITLGKELIKDDWWHADSSRSRVLSDFIDFHLMMIGEHVMNELMQQEK